MSRMLQALKRLEPQLPRVAVEALTAPAMSAPTTEPTPPDIERADLFSAAICHVAEAIQVLPQSIGLPTYPEITFSAPEALEPAELVGSASAVADDLATALKPEHASATPYDGVASELLTQLSGATATALVLVSLERVDPLLAMIVPLCDALGRRFQDVLVVDCDLREPTLGERFAVPTGRGLIDLLPGPARWQDVVRPTQLAGVDLLPGRRLVAADGRPPERLDLQPLVHEWLDRYRLVLLAAGPASNPEAGSLLRSAHAAVLILEAGRTRQRAARKAVRSIRTAGAHLLGTVVADPAAQVA